MTSLGSDSMSFVFGRRTVLSSMLLATLWLTACRRQDFPQYAANYREYAYVANGGSNTVTVLDVVNLRLDREVAVGENPVALTANPVRNEVYVVNEGAATAQGSVSVIDAEHNLVAATIPVHRQPVAIDVAPDGLLAYVANSGSNSISVLDLKARREIAVIGAGEEPVALRVAPDGKTLAVANRKGDSLSLIDPATRTVRSVFAGCPGAADVVILPDSSKAFAACSGGHQILAVLLARAANADRPSRADALEAILDVGRAPAHLALKPDGGELFASNSLGDSVSEVATTTSEVGGATIMGDHPVRGLISRDNTLLYEANFRSQEITTYAIDDGRRSASIHVGDGPSALAFSAAGHLLFVVDSGSGDIAVIRTATHSLFTMLPAGHGPDAIVIKAFHLT